MGFFFFLHTVVGPRFAGFVLYVEEVVYIISTRILYIYVSRICVCVCRRRSSQNRFFADRLESG